MGGAQNEPVTATNALQRFNEAALSIAEPPSFRGRGIIIAAGGAFLPGAYVVVRLLRQYGVTLPIELWHAGEDEIPEWGRRALASSEVSLRDIMAFCPDRAPRDMRGWPIKPAAILHSTLREALFLDADCFPLCDPSFLFDSPAFRQDGAVFWPDNRSHKLVRAASIWSLTGLAYNGDAEFETGIFLIDKLACWKELCLAEWMNQHAYFWYRHVLGDKDTFYLAWRKLGRRYLLGPPCKRYRAVVTRHFWIDGRPLADHRTGTSKYALPRKRGPFTTHLLPYHGRGNAKNVYDELMQRFLVRDFAQHVAYLDELDRFCKKDGVSA